MLPPHGVWVTEAIKKQASLASIRLRAVVMAPTGRRATTIQVTSRQYGSRAIYVSGDVRFQDGDAFDLGKLGGGDVLLHLIPLSFNVCTSASLFCNKVHT